MRTTIAIDDHLLDRLKSRAAASGTTVSRLIEEAVRLMLTRSSNQSEPPSAFTLVTFGEGGQFSNYNIDKTAELIAAEDQERHGKRP